MGLKRKAFTPSLNSIIFVTMNTIKFVFREMKEAETRVAENLDVAPTLPGWGSWAGEGIVPSKRKKNPRRLIDIAKLPKRKDKDRLDTIINENENPNIKEHAVIFPIIFTHFDAFVGGTLMIFFIFAIGEGNSIPIQKCLGIRSKH